MNSIVKNVSIERGNIGLGFILSSQSPCIVSSVNQNGAADHAGLQTGDEILEVDRVDVSLLKHDEVVRHILNYQSLIVQLKVRTFKPSITNKENKHIMSKDNQDDENVDETLIEGGSEENELVNTTNSTPKRNIFDNLNKVIKDIRSSVIFNSPMSLKKFDNNFNNKESYLIDDKENRMTASSTASSNYVVIENTSSMKAKYNMEQLSKRRQINETDYNDSMSKRRPLSQIFTRQASNRLSKSFDTSLEGTQATSNTSNKPKFLSNLFGIGKQNTIEENENELATLLEPGLTPVKFQDGVKKHVYKAVVFYHCSVEMAKSTNLLATSLETLNNCVCDIKNETSSHHSSGMVLLTISTNGVKLTNPHGKEIITYPLKTLVFSGICTEDRQYFGLVTKRIFVDQSGAMSSAFSQSPPHIGAKSLVVCCCHVFMIDMTLTKHVDHVNTATLFGASCTPCIQAECCEEFPCSPSRILQELNSFYTERPQRSRNASVTSCASTISSTGLLSPEHQAPLLLSPERQIISNTLDQLRGNSFSTTPRDTKKLMVKPPSSLLGLNEVEKTELLQEIQADEVMVADHMSASQMDFYDDEQMHKKFSEHAGRRKSAPDTEMFTSTSLHRGENIARINGNYLKVGNRRPPSASRKNQMSNKKLSDNMGELKTSQSTLFAGFRRIRRKSDGSTLSPSMNLKDLFKGTLTRKIDTPQSIAKHDTRKDTNANVKSISNASSELSLDSLGRVESWARAFENLLADPIGIRCFQEFLKKEFSEENVLFWAACEKFKKTKDVEKKKLLAGDIFRNYLSPKGAFLVNVDQQAMKVAEDNINTPTSEMFTLSQEQVFHLMKFDSYNRFLKSELYQECLLAESEDRLFPFEDEIDEELRRKSAWLKKSKSTLNDTHDRKKNILNFLSKTNGKVSRIPDHEIARKERSSSLSAVEEFCRKNNGVVSPNSNGHNYQDNNQLWEGFQSKANCSFVRVQLPDGTSTMIVAERGQTIRESLKDVCLHKSIDMKSYDVTVGETRQVTNPDGDICIFQDNVIYLEKRILLRFDLPNGRSVGIKANPKKTIKEVLQPVMRKNGFDINNYSISVVNTRNIVLLDSSITIVENKRLGAKLLSKKLERQNSDIVSSKPPSQDFRSSFRRFRTGSFKEDKGKLEKISTMERDRVEKERLTPTHKTPEMKSEETTTFSRKLSVEVKHLLLGRTKSADDDGASALISVLRKSQSGRLDDQRGMLPKDLELPDFLKVSSNTPSPVRSIFKSSKNSSPSKSSMKYPASPIIIESMHDDDENNTTISSVNPSLCSVRSWRDMSSPDQQLINSSCNSQDFSIISTNTTLSYDSIDSRNTLLELSRSDSLLNETYSKNNLCKENSAPPALNGAFNKSNTRHRANSYDIYEPHSSSNESLPRTQSASTRPHPINLFDESHVLRELGNTDSPNSTFPKSHHKESASDNNLFLNNQYGHIPDTSGKNHHNGLVKSRSYHGTSPIKMDSVMKPRGLTLDINKTKLSKKLSSVDIVEYDTSPRASEAYRSLSFPIAVSTKDTVNGNSIVTAVPTNKSAFQSNAIPTPEKEKLLHGETIRGRQNEKITFV